MYLWCNDNYFARWKEIETDVDGYQIQSAIGEKEIPPLIKDKIDSITYGTLELWFNFVRQFILRRDQSILRWIAFDTQFEPGDNDTIFKQWAVKVLGLCAQ